MTTRCSLVTTTLIAVLAAGCGGDKAHVAGEDGCPYWSPDGRYVAFERAYNRAGDLQWDVHVVDAAGRSLRRLTRTSENEEVLGWRSSPQQIIFDRGGRYPRYSPLPDDLPESRQLLALAPTEQAEEMKIGDLSSANRRVLSPDGSWLAVVTVEQASVIHSDVIVTSLGGVKRWTLPRNYTGVGLPRWSPDSTKLAYADSNEVFRVVRRDGRTLGRIAGNRPVWSPDSRMIAYQGPGAHNNEWAIRVYDVGRRTSRRLRPVVDELAWSPDSRTVLYNGAGYKRSALWAVRVDGGGSSRRLFSTGGLVYCLRFSPSGNRLAFLRVTLISSGIVPNTNEDLVLANADGSDMRLVTSGGSR